MCLPAQYDPSVALPWQKPANGFITTLITPKRSSDVLQLLGDLSMSCVNLLREPGVENLEAAGIHLELYKEAGTGYCCDTKGSGSMQDYGEKNMYNHIQITFSTVARATLVLLQLWIISQLYFLVKIGRTAICHFNI